MVPPSTTPKAELKPALNFKRLGERVQIRDGALYLPVVELLRVMGYSKGGVLEGKVRFESLRSKGGLTAYQDLSSDTLYALLEDVMKLPGVTSRWVPEQKTLFLKLEDREVSFQLELGKLSAALKLPQVLQTK